MTAPRRALPARPTRLQRLAGRLTSAQRHEALVNALEDRAARLDDRSRQYGTHNLYGQTCDALAAELRRILQEHA